MNKSCSQPRLPGPTQKILGEAEGVCGGRSLAETVPQEEEMERGRKGKVDLGVEEMDH